MTLNLGAAIAHISSIRTDLAQRTGCTEWDNGGIRAALIATEGAPCDVSAAACLAAGDESLKYPSRQAFITHWPKNATAAPRASVDVECVDHPGEVMPCRTCQSERYVPTDADRRAWRDALAATRHDTPNQRRQEATR